MAPSNNIVFLDANIWISERLLKSAMGAAFLYSIRQMGGKIGLPYVTEVELIRGAATDGLKAVKSIETGFTTIQTLTGFRPDYQLPTGTDFENKAKERVTELSELISKLDVSLDQYKDALNRVVDGVPPNRTREQYRDTLLWEVIRQIASPETEIVLITRDSDFYQENKFERGLAKELAREISELDGIISIYPDLESYLLAIKEKIPPFEYDTVAAAISSFIFEDTRQYAVDRNIGLSSLSEYNMDAFLTERDGYLAITYKLRYHAEDLDGTAQNVQFVLVTGKCFYHISSGAISDSSLDRIECVDQSGQRIPAKGTVYIDVGGAYQGVRMIPYSIRRRLET
jgi:hypothetical protein